MDGDLAYLPRAETVPEEPVGFYLPVLWVVEHDASVCGALGALVLAFSLIREIIPIIQISETKHDGYGNLWR